MSAHSGEERLGPYRLREQLGEGGMGVVYLAEDPDDRQVAVKVLRQGIPAEATARRRLAREVDTMRRVRSPFVAEVVDADVEGSPPYIVTEYVAGQTLEDVVATDGPLTGQALAALARGLAGALAAIHAAGVVHRDLKPGNVMLVDGDPVVIDFGIAQAPDSTRLTMTGMFMGTPGYLAPEVIEGKPSGPAADVHSWAATLAYAATGRPPFGTGQFEAIFYRIVHGQPELDTMPAPLLPIVLAALARDPSKRPSAEDLADLTAALDPGALVRAPAGAALLASEVSGQATRTALDLPAAPLRGLADGQQAALGSAPALPVRYPAASGPGTKPIAALPRDNFADLLPPVRYDQPPAAGLAAVLPGVPGQLAPAQPWPAASWPYGQPAPAGPGQPGSALTGAQPGIHSAGDAGAQPLPPRLPLVLATMAGFVAVSVLLPIAGAAAALAALVLLRAGDVTTRWLGRRRGRLGRRRSDAISATLFYPWAVCRSVASSLLIAPLALLCAVAAAVLSVLVIGPDQLSRAGADAAGALIACYCIGPGSAAARRPLSRFYGRVTRSVPAAVLGSIGAAAVAFAVIAAAATLAPGFWPASHLGNQLQSGQLLHPGLGHLSGNVAGLGRRLLSWLGL
ncbi:MAG TPA: protein kinase [Streptosporangiaceae bacterium]|nr:protein kinase [Streptosporangiaceae bacterium]